MHIEWQELEKKRDINYQSSFGEFGETPRTIEVMTNDLKDHLLSAERIAELTSERTGERN